MVTKTKRPRGKHKKKDSIEEIGRSDEEEKGMQITIRMKDGSLKAQSSIGEIQWSSYFFQITIPQARSSCRSA
jgi:hypothetical protein